MAQTTERRELESDAFHLMAGKAEQVATADFWEPQDLLDSCDEAAARLLSEILDDRQPLDFWDPLVVCQADDFPLDMALTGIRLAPPEERLRLAA